MKRHKLNKTNYSNYQSLFLWVNFLWSLISLGVVGQRMGVQAQGLPATLDLASLMANEGTVIQGAATFDYSAHSVASAGDVNGDNISDVVVGAYRASPLNRTQAGAMYIIYGSKTLPGVLDLNTLTVTQGMVVQGAGAGDRVGASVSGAGDVNGDGFSDIVVGAYLASPLNRTQAGAAYIIYGSKTLPGVLDLKSLTATQGMVVQGAAANDQTDYSVASSGDVNGDGTSDLVVGANNASTSGRVSAGAVYLIYGSKTLPAVLDLNSLTRAPGVVIQGAVMAGHMGISVSGAGDVNGDGTSDVVVGAFEASPLNRASAGVAYLIYGSRTLPAVLDLNALTRAQGMLIQGAVKLDYLGSLVSSAGDVNSDGISDLVIGANNASPLNRRNAGSAYLIYGSKTFPAVLDLNITLTATQGMVIQGAAVGDNAGISVSSAGDVNGDNITDLVVGAYEASPLSRLHAGAAYIIYGQAFKATTVATSILPTTESTASSSATISAILATTNSAITSPVSLSSLRATAVGATTPNPRSTTKNPSISMVSSTPKSSDATTVSESPTQGTTPGVTSGNPGTGIGPAVGGVVGGIALTACLTAVGFYACRKKAGANQSSNSASNNATLHLRIKILLLRDQIMEKLTN
jgi:hypothetical protein